MPLYVVCVLSEQGTQVPSWCPDFIPQREDQLSLWETVFAQPYLLVCQPKESK